MNELSWARAEIKLMEEDLEEIVYEHLPEYKLPIVKKCEWCSQPLPNERYHLKICPRCRKSSVEAFVKGHS